MNATSPVTLRAAIYARFSSTLQNPRSIEDQIRLCRIKVRDLGAVVGRVYSDPASTGTTTQARPGLGRLLEDAKHGLIDLVCTESLDRISRDQADIAGIYKRLRYWNTQLATLQEREIKFIHVSIGGLMNQAYIVSLASKTRRGQIGAVYSNRIPGGVCYGYQIANRINEHGRPIRGLRKIDPEQANTVRRIYRLYADGKSVRDIAIDLNRERIPGPRGNAWGPATINGNRKRRNGILHNELYRGRIVYGRQRFIRDPETGKRQARPVPPSEWTIHEVPNLRIVDDGLWHRVQERLRAGWDRRKNPTSHTLLPFSGLIRCAECGGNMVIVNRRRYACQAHLDKVSCHNPRGIDAICLENQICALLAMHIAEESSLPELERRAARENAQRRKHLDAARADGKQRMSRLLDSMEQGIASQAAHRRLLEIEHETAAIEAELGSLPTIPGRTPEGHAARLRDRLGVLNRTIADSRPGSKRRRDALLLVRSLIERIDIKPLPGRRQMKIVARPHTDALVAFALQEKWEVGAQAAGHAA